MFMSLTWCFCICQERVSELECEVREKHKMEIKLQSLIEVRLIYYVYIGRFQTRTLPRTHQENSTLSSQLAAQQSVAEGLREERQLWGQELAQQGAELAQDRGRMEAQIESLTSETASLREELQVLYIHTDYSMHQYILHTFGIYVL